MAISHANTHAALYLLLTELWRPGNKIVVCLSTLESSGLTRSLFWSLEYSLVGGFGGLMTGMLEPYIDNSWVLPHFLRVSRTIPSGLNHTSQTRSLWYRA